jgi:hypothetical protein
LLTTFLDFAGTGVNLPTSPQEPMTNSEEGAHEMKAIFNSLAHRTSLVIFAFVLFPIAVQAA